MLGLEIAPAEVEAYLRGLELKVTSGAAGVWQVDVPATASISLLR